MQLPVLTPALQKFRLLFCLFYCLLLGSWLLFLGATGANWQGVLLLGIGPLLLLSGMGYMPATFWKELRGNLRGTSTWLRGLLVAGTVLIVVVNYATKEAWVAHTIFALLLIYGAMLLLTIILAMIGYHAEKRYA